MLTRINAGKIFPGFIASPRHLRVLATRRACVARFWRP
jgi:hypothetical protein